MDYGAKYGPMQTAVEDFYRAAKSMDGYAQRLGGVKTQLGWFSGLAGYKIGVGAREASVNAAMSKAIRAGQCLDDARIEYLLSEQRSYQLISGDTSFQIGDGAAPTAIPHVGGRYPYNGVFPIISPIILDILKRLGWTVDCGAHALKVPSLWDFMVGKEKIEYATTALQIAKGALVLSFMDFAGSFYTQSGKGKIWESDKNYIYKWTSDPKSKSTKELGGISIYGVGGKIEGSLFKAEYSGEYGSISARLGTAEAHWSADAGMYYYDKDGNKFWSPRIAAEVGASATLLAINAEGKYLAAGKGTDTTLDDFGVQAKGEVNVGKVSATAKVQSTFLDENGNFKPEIKASANAEALLVEAKGSAGVTIAGVEANVTGKVGVGVGAKAEVGYSDGKFSFEVGAYLGVGGSVGFEVDIGGAVDAVCTGAKAVWNWLTPW